MKTFSQVTRTFCMILFCCILTGCSSATNVNPEPDIQKQFDDYTNQLFTKELTRNTLNMHYTLANPKNYGIEDYVPTLGSFSVEYMDEVSEDLEEMRSQLTSIDTTLLREDQLLTHRLLLDYVETELSVSQYPLYSELLSPTTGYQAQLPVLLAEYTFRTRRDIEDYLALLSLVDDIYADIITFEIEKSAQGLFMSDFAADAIIDQCQEFINNPEDNYMIAVFNDKIANLPGLSADEQSQYIERNHTLITTEVVSAYQSLIDGMMALKGTGTNDLGLYYYDHGTEYYEYLVRTNTGSDNSVKELQKRTDEFIYDSINKMQALIQEDPYVYDKLNTYRFPSEQPEDILTYLTDVIYEDFPELSSVPHTVKYIHPSMEEHLSPAFYLTPPIDDLNNNVIYINNKYLDADIFPTIAHEGYPGHLYQTVYTASANLPLVRNILSYQGFSEGWATYVEYYSYDISGLEPSVAELLRLDDSITLGIYASIDMGIHYDGWDRTDTKDYLSGFGITDSATADLIFETLVQEPANYLSYFIGSLEFKTLREQAEKELGSNFTAKEFHKFILEMGPSPFYIIQDQMELWITEQKAQ